MHTPAPTSPATSSGATRPAPAPSQLEPRPTESGPAPPRWPSATPRTWRGWRRPRVGKTRRGCRELGRLSKNWGGVAGGGATCREPWGRFGRPASCPPGALLPGERGGRASRASPPGLHRRGRPPSPGPRPSSSLGPAPRRARLGLDFRSVLGLSRSPSPLQGKEDSQMLKLPGTPRDGLLVLQKQDS